MNAIKTGILSALFTMALHGATSAQGALYCNGPSECDSKAISLIKKATKAGCDASGFAGTLGQAKFSASEFDASAIQALEVCIEKKKYEASLAKKAEKRVERINKALGR